MTEMVRDQLLARTGDQSSGLLFEGSSWTWAEVVRAAAVHASVLRELLPVDRPPHVGVLLDNTPSFAFLLAAASLDGQVIVGLDPNRSPSELAADVARTDVALVLSDGGYQGSGLLAEVTVPVLLVDSPQWIRLVEGHGDAPTDTPSADVSPDTLLMLIFTSGTAGEPKAVRVTQGKVARRASGVVETHGLSAEDVVYVAMPLVHANALMVAFAPALAAGATVALTRRFSPDGFLADVRRHGATYTSYVGGALARVLGTAEQPDDADNPLRLAVGSEAGDPQIEAFARRFDCAVVDTMVSTELGLVAVRETGQPPGSVGRAVPGITVCDPATGIQTPVAELGPHGELLNPEAAIGELVTAEGPGEFAGYYGESGRLRDGRFWSGDLAFRDAEGWLYSAGRRIDLMQIDGETVAGAPVERVLLRHPAIAQAAVYAVLGPDGATRLMAALVVAGSFGPNDLGDFLRAQRDLPARLRPRYVRLAPVERGLPTTVSHKLLKRDLVALGTWPSDDELWRLDDATSAYVTVQ